MEDSPPSTTQFKPIIEDYGYGNSDLATKILEDEVTDELDSFSPVIRQWFRHFRRTDEEKKNCDNLTGFIYRFQYHQAFKAVNMRRHPRPHPESITRCGNAWPPPTRLQII